LGAALIYAAYASDLPQSKRMLTRLGERYPATAAGRQAPSLLVFFEENSDFQGKPLAHYLRGRLGERREDYTAAAESYLAVPEKWPQARVADRALLAGAQLLLHRLDRAADALAHLKRFDARYAKSALRAEAALERARAIEAVNGPGAAALAAYRDVVAQHADTPFADQASARIQQIQDSGLVLTRQYGKEFVRDYKVVKQGLAEGRVYTVIVEVGSNLSERELSATLEAALVAHAAKRAERDHHVRVEAYFTYPLSKAGEAYWEPGKPPTYKVKERETEDVLKDVLFDMLKRR